MRTRGLCGRAHTVDRHGRARRTFATTGGANVRPRASRRAPGAFAPAPPYCAVSARRDSSERPSGAPDRAHSKRLTRLLAVPVRSRAELAEVADDLAVLRLEGTVLADLREVAAASAAVDHALGARRERCARGQPHRWEGAPVSGRSAHRKFILLPGPGQSERSTCERRSRAPAPLAPASPLPRSQRTS